MKVLRPRFAAALGCSLAVLAAGTIVPAAGAAGVHSSRAHARVGLIECAGKLATRPKTYLLACGDGSVGLIHVKWKAFGGQTARGTGTLVVNRCEPNCAAGKVIRTSVSVVASAPRTIASHRSYSKLSLTRKGGKSAGRYGIDKYGPSMLLEG